MQERFRLGLGFGREVEAEGAAPMEELQQMEVAVGPPAEETSSRRKWQRQVAAPVGSGADGGSEVAPPGGAGAVRGEMGLARKQQPRIVTWIGTRARAGRR
jgi:hypothetical protein